MARVRAAVVAAWSVAFWASTAGAQPAPLDAPGDATPPEVLAAVARLNTVRALAHLAPVALDPAMARACGLHADYLVQNRGRPEIAGLRAHEEVPSLPGYTPEGAAAGRASDIDEQGPVAAIDAWVNSLYHRTPILRPALRRVGLAARGTGDHARSVLMFADADDDAGYPVAYPADGQTDVPIGFGDEIPSPVPIPRPDLAGSPITLALGRRAVAGVTADLTDASGAPVAFWLSSPEHPATAFPQGGVVCLFPRERLRPGTTYRVRIAASDLAPVAWQFTTALPRPVAGGDFAAAERAVDALVSLRGDVVATGTIPGYRFLQVGRDGDRLMSVLIPDEVWPRFAAQGVDAVSAYTAQHVEAIGALHAGPTGSFNVTTYAPTDLQVVTAALPTVESTTSDLIRSLGRLCVVRGRVTYGGNIPGYAFLQLGHAEGRAVSVLIPDALWTSLGGAAPQSLRGTVVTVRGVPEALPDGSINVAVGHRSQVRWDPE